MSRYAALLLGLAATTPALAQSSDLTAIAGKPVKVYHAMAMDPGCSSTGDPEYRIITMPQLGKLSTKKAKEYPRYAESNPRHVCNTRALPAVQLWYAGPRGAMGTDQFEFMVVYPSGSTERKAIRVNVIP